MPLHVSSTCAHRQKAKTVFYSLWYHHTETIEWPKVPKITKITKTQFCKYDHIVVKLMCEFYYYVFILIELYFSNFSYFSNYRKKPLTCFSVMIPEAV